MDLSLPPPPPCMNGPFSRALQALLHPQQRQNVLNEAVRPPGRVLLRLCGDPAAGSGLHLLQTGGGAAHLATVHVCIVNLCCSI